MSTASPRGWHQSREAAGFLVSVAFVCLAAVRDVYLGGLLQRVSPLRVAAGAQPVGMTALGVMLAASGGISISVSTMLCRKLNDAGVTPGTLLALRYPATVLSAAGLASLLSSDLPAALSLRVDAFMVIASLLIVLPSYVNQVGISLASPLTVRVVLAAGPVLIFFVQLRPGRRPCQRVACQ